MPPLPDHSFDVLDAHHHYGDLTEWGGTLPTATPLGDISRDEYHRIELETRLAAMDEQNVRQAVIIGSHAYLRPNGLVDTRRVNDGVATYCARMPERFPAGVGIAEPLYGEAGLAEIDRIRDELGLVGISFHVRFQGVSMDGPWVHRYVERILDAGLVPYLHAIGDSPENALWKIETLAAGFPDARMVVLDGFSNYEQTREIRHLAGRQPGLVFDTSLAYSFEMIMPVIREHGVERIVFGTDVYSMVPKARNVLDEILASELDDAEKSAVLGGTLRGILGLETDAPRAR
jgi:predicted TIM-barrel fold metal-dependent hydrolase